MPPTSSRRTARAPAPTSRLRCGRRRRRWRSRKRRRKSLIAAATAFSPSATLRPASANSPDEMVRAAIATTAGTARQKPATSHTRIFDGHADLRQRLDDEGQDDQQGDEGRQPGDRPGAGDGRGIVGHEREPARKFSHPRGIARRRRSGGRRPRTWSARRSGVRPAPQAPCAAASRTASRSSRRPPTARKNEKTAQMASATSASPIDRFR